MLYWCLTFLKDKQLEINHFPWFYFDFSRWIKKRIEEEDDGKNQKSTLESWPNLAFKFKLEIFEFINFLVKSYISGGMGLKKKKFVIQWRKFE